MPNPRRAGRTATRSLSLAAFAGTAALVVSALSSPAGAETTRAPGAPVRVAASTATHADQSPGATRSGQTSRAERALKALTRAKTALSPHTAAGKRPEATLALRKLWMMKGSLAPSDRAAADKLATRPDKPAEAGDANISIHYDPAELTTYSIEDALASLTYVANTYAGSGYRRPLPDGNLGGDGRIDIYLDQLDSGLYGYCTTDQKRYKPRSKAVWAYCVLDADYIGFPRTPVENLDVTAAHEYYHATQFAYDFSEDPWFLEATAAWAEDRLYDDVNDNYQYLADSPITKPGKSVDKFGGVFHYGVWNFMEYITERYPSLTGALPTVMLKMWKYADSAKGPRKDRYSLQAIGKALRRVGGTTLDKVFADYSAATRYTHLSFAEGAALNYPVKPLAGAIALGPAKKKQAFRTSLDHLTSQTYQFVPSGTSPTSQLKLRLKMGKKQTGARAVVTIFGPSGILASKSLKVNRNGLGKKKFAFAGGGVTSVEVTLVNASTRYRNCYVKDTVYSCSGNPVDQNIKAVLKAKATA